MLLRFWLKNRNKLFIKYLYGSYIQVDQLKLKHTINIHLSNLCKFLFKDCYKTKDSVNSALMLYL